MVEGFIMFSLFCLLVSPIIFFCLKKRVLAYGNLVVTLGTLAIWLSLISGWVIDKFWIVMWNITLLGAVLFLVVGLSIVFLKVKRKNLYLLPILFLAVAVGSLLLGNSLGNGTLLNFIVLYSFVYFTPMFVVIISLIGATQHYNNIRDRVDNVEV
jgi:hypothetical protein